MLLFFVRHGDPVYWPQEELTPLGLRQAEAVAKRLALYGIDKIYSSPLKRARQTAAPLLEYVKKEPVILDWCSEDIAWKEFALDIDDKGGRNWAFQHCPEIFNDKSVLSLGENWTEHERFKDTTFESGIKRVRKETDEFLLSLGYKHDRENKFYLPVSPTEKRVTLFAHQGFGMVFLSALLDIPYPEFCTRFDFGHTGVTVIEFKENKGKVIPKILQLSNDSHLYKENIPTKYQNRIFF